MSDSPPSMSPQDALVAVMIAVSASACGRMADLDAPPAKRTERGMRDERAPNLPEPATIYRPPSQAPRKPPIWWLSRVKPNSVAR